MTPLTPTDIISDVLLRPNVTASTIVAARANHGYHYVQEQHAKITPGHVVLA